MKIKIHNLYLKKLKRQIKVNKYFLMKICVNINRFKIRYNFMITNTQTDPQNIPTNIYKRRSKKINNYH